MKPLEWAKKHPYSTGVIVIVGGVAFFMISGFGRSAASPEVMTIATGPSDATMQANASLRLAEMNLSAQQQQLNASKEVDLANIAAQTKVAESASAASVQVASIQSQTMMSQYNVELQMAQLNTAAIEYQALYNYKAQSESIAANVAVNTINSNNSLTLGLDNNQTALGLAKIEADVAKYQTDAQKYVTDKTYDLGALQSNNSFQLGMSQIESNNFVASTNADASKFVASTNADASKYSADIGLKTVERLSDSLDKQTQVQRDISAFENHTARIGIDAQVAMNANTNKTNKSINKTSTIGKVIGGIAGTIGAIFSDERLKENITKKGELPNGIGLYEYQYKWSDEWHLGVMAQEVLRVRPDAVATDPNSGAYMVDYGMLN